MQCSLYVMDEHIKWFLENDADDEMLKELDLYDLSLSEEGFKQFQEKVGVSRRPCHGFLRVVERIAVVLLVPLAVTVAFLAFKKPIQPQWNEVYTQSCQTRTVTLPDGSIIKLAPQSRMVYPSAFNRERRQVFMEGEAYADIAHIDGCPFEIHSQDITVRVFGTEFNFSSYQSDSECELALVDGSVEMVIDGRNSNHILQMKTGDMVCYDRSKGDVSKRRFSPDAYIANFRKDGLQFSNRKMEDIAHCLERKFGAKIIIEDSALAQERFYASFINGEDLPSILQSLNTQNRMRIVRKGDNYYLSYI